MWRKAKNVTITYNQLPPKTSGSSILLEDIVESVPTQSSWMPQPRKIRGVDTPDGEGAWNWRGSGLLKIASSHWEVLGWGESEIDGGLVERWVVTWFAPSLFTPAGLDVYSSRREGLSKRTYDGIMRGLEKLEVKELVDMARKDMMEVKIEY